MQQPSQLLVQRASIWVSFSNQSVHILSKSSPSAPATPGSTLAGCCVNNPSSNWWARQGFLSTVMEARTESHLREWPFDKSCSCHWNIYFSVGRHLHCGVLYQPPVILSLHKEWYLHYGKEPSWWLWYKTSTSSERNCPGGLEWKKVKLYVILYMQLWFYNYLLAHMGWQEWPEDEFDIALAF